jgi:hypothetical protein
MRHPPVRVAGAIVTSFFAWALAAAPPLPDTLARRGATGPFFVSAQAATNGDGSIRWEALSHASRMALQVELPVSDERDRRRTDAGGEDRCPVFTYTVTHVHGDTHALAPMIATAPAVYRAEVVAMEEGLDGSVPTSLVAATIVRTVRAGADFPTTGLVYFFYPRADFTIGGHRFCNAGPNLAYAPQVGDRVLIFAYDAPADETGLFLNVRPEQLVLERGGRLFPISSFASDPPIRGGTLESLENAVTAAVRRPARQ